MSYDEDESWFLAIIWDLLNVVTILNFVLNHGDSA